jgi:glycerol-3-phosphate dehydrogenase
MGEDAVDKAILLAGLPERKSITENLMIHSFSQNTSLNDPNSVYGTDVKMLEEIAEEKEYSGLLNEELQISKAQLILAIREEMARTVEDFLARRTRALFLDARESIKMCPEVASIMAKELGYDSKWTKDQIDNFTLLAKGYYLD